MQNTVVKKHIAILGIGTVGGGTYEILTKEAALIKKSQGIELSVKKVLDRTKELVVKRGVPSTAAASSIEEIINDKDISLVVETMGGVEPAKTFILKCLTAKKSVVSANKELIAKHGNEIEKTAADNGVGFYYEASVAGGIPIIRVLEESMQANNLLQVMGIVNGTTNFILTKMAEEGSSYQDVLKEAQRLGFAETDPTADVDGFDSMYKLSILASLAFRVPVSYTDIYREGITQVSADDIANAKSLGYNIKLLAIAGRDKKGIEVRVHPCFVSMTHPLSSVRNEFNAVFIKGDSVDDIMLYGRGAGALPTASAICSDIVACLKHGAKTNSVFNSSDKIAVVSNFTSSYYLAVTVEDKAGVLAKITEVFGKHKVSIAQMMQKAAKGGFAELVFLIHPSLEHSMQAAIKDLKKLKEVKSTDSLIRVL